MSVSYVSSRLVVLVIALALAACTGPAATAPAASSTAVPPRPTVVSSATPSAYPRPSVAPSATPTTAAFSFSALQQTMFRLINRDRQAVGLAPLAWDETAARVGQAHAEEMLAANYMSHWNQAGYGPDHRYAFAGGLDAAFENVHSSYYRYSDGRGVPITDWEAKLAEVEKGFMNSPGHRQQILDPAHTHVGVGMAYNPANGELRVAQEFVNRYAQIDSTPGKASPGAKITLQGRLLQKGLEPVLVSVAYQDFPRPMSVAQLNQTGTYVMAGGAEAGEVGQHPEITGDQVQATLTVGGKVGLYHLRLWVTVNGQQTLAVDRIMEVR